MLKTLNLFHNQNSEAAIMKISVKRMFFKTRHNPSIACKGIQCLQKLYTAIMKPLPLKWIPSQIPIPKIFNFSNDYVLVHIIFCWKSSTRIDREKFQKMLKHCWTVASQTSVAKNFYVVSYWKAESHTKKFVCSDASLCRVSVTLVVKFYREWFYREIFCKSFFKHIETATSEITKKHSVILIQSQVAEYHCIPYRVFSNFSCVLFLSSALTFSVLFSPHFCRDKVKMLSDIR